MKPSPMRKPRKSAKNYNLQTHKWKRKMNNIYIAIGLLWAYIFTVCWYNKCIPPYLSKTFFRLNGWGRFLMVAVVTASAVLTMPILTDITPWRWMIVVSIGLLSMFISVVCILTDSRITHKYWTFIFYLSTQIYITPCFWLLVGSWVPWLLWFVWVTKDRPWRTQCFWAEITCILNFFSYTIYHLSC